MMNSNALRLNLDEAIKERHSTRLFLPKPVPRDLLDEALTLAQLAPSNSNIEPWHVVFVSGPPRDRLVAALLDEAKRQPPTGAALPEQFQHFRAELGSQIYGAMGICQRRQSRSCGCNLTQLGVLSGAGGRDRLPASRSWPR